MLMEKDHTLHRKLLRTSNLLWIRMPIGNNVKPLNVGPELRVVLTEQTTTLMLTNLIFMSQINNNLFEFLVMKT